MTPPRGSASVADRAAEVQPDAQDGLFDNVIENELLEQALERYQKAKEALKPKKKAFDDADTAAKGIIAGLEMAPGEGDEPVVIRCGRFRIKQSYTEPGHRSFDTGESTRTTISLL